MLELILLLVIFILAQFPLLKNYEPLGVSFDSKNASARFKEYAGKLMVFKTNTNTLNAKIISIFRPNISSYLKAGAILVKCVESTDLNNGFKQLGETANYG